MTGALESVRFDVLGPPRPKARPRVTTRGTFTPAPTREYEQAVRQTARLWCGSWRTDGEYRVTLVFVFASQPRGDVDNYAKGALDGLQRVAFRSDKQVVEVRARREVKPHERERTEVLVERVGDAPPVRRKARRP